MNKEFTMADAMASLFPGVEWSMYGNDPDRIVWHTEPPHRPTREELEAEVTRLQSEYDGKLYARQRAPEYPPLSDLADALYWQAQGDNEPMARYVAACEAVKAKYPKGGNDA